MKEITIQFPDHLVEDIEHLILYKNLKDLLFTESNDYLSFEDFIIGCTYHYIKRIKHQLDLSGINDLGKPFRLQNNLKEYMDKKGVSQAMLAERTGIGASNLSLIMKNKNQPSLDYFFRIWIALECPPMDKIFYRLEE